VKLQGKVVLVGTSAAGIAEWLVTPFGPTFPGIETHAAVVDNLLTGDLIAEPGWSRSLVLLLVVIPGAALSLLFRFTVVLSSALSPRYFSLLPCGLTMQQFLSRRSVRGNDIFLASTGLRPARSLLRSMHRAEQKRAEDALR
jgi:CHASE2 domain-containing sensor protein